VQNCWGFIDGTARTICRPSINQQEYYSAHKRQHCLKYQSVLCPDGIIVSLHGPYSGRRHDAGMFIKCNLAWSMKLNFSMVNDIKFSLQTYLEIRLYILN